MNYRLYLIPLAAAALASGCLAVKTEHEVKPIHITMDINLKIDRELDNYFDDIYDDSNAADAAKAPAADAAKAPAADAAK